MSGQSHIKRHAWVASLSPLSGIDKSVLRVLADHAHCETLTCWPSIDTIVRESGFCERAAQRAITRLVSAKVIDLLPSKGRKANRYVLRIPNPVGEAGFNPAPETGFNPVPETGLENPNPVPETPLPRTRDGVNPVPETPEPVIEPVIEPLSCSSADERGSAFLIFWGAYPRKEHKAKAMGIWKRHKVDDQLHTILQDLEARKAHCEQWRRDDGRYIPLPTRYLEGHLWHDHWQPPRRKSEYEPMRPHKPRNEAREL